MNACRSGRAAPDRRERAGAFTLVEALATLVLMAIILPVAMRGISLALAAAGEAKRQAEAASLAESKLAELRATGAWKGSDLAGDFGDEHPNYKWKAAVENRDGASLWELEVAVMWTGRGGTRTVTLTTWIYDGGA